MKKVIINLTFAIITDILQEGIDDEYIRDRLIELTEHLEKVPKALTDKDKNDKQQLIAIWKDARPDLVNWGLKEAKEEIDYKITDPQKRVKFKNWLTEISSCINGESQD